MLEFMLEMLIVIMISALYSTHLS